MKYEICKEVQIARAMTAAAPGNRFAMPREPYKPWNGVYPLVEREYFDTLQEAEQSMRLMQDADNYFKQACGI